MKSKSSFIACVAALILFCSCRLTRADVIGTWAMPKNDTLYILSNNIFKLMRPNYSEVTGTWTIRKTVLSFNFDDSLQEFAPRCNFYQYIRTKGRKTSLVKPVSCEVPSNRFTSIKKIN